MTYRKKLIEVALPLDAINKASARKKSMNGPGDELRINVLLEKATRALGGLNAFTLIVPDVDLFILYMVSHGLLSKPSLYLSAHLEKQLGTYYDALTRVRESNDLGHWCRFFLQGVSETAENGKRTFQSILNLREDL